MKLLLALTFLISIGSPLYSQTALSKPEQNFEKLWKEGSLVHALDPFSSMGKYLSLLV
jgi:hypothetical protein